MFFFRSPTLDFRFCFYLNREIQHSGLRPTYKLKILQVGLQGIKSLINIAAIGNHPGDSTTKICENPKTYFNSDADVE